MTERRIRDRKRTRLHPAKILDREGAFVCDCAIIDRSADGAKVRFFAPTRIDPGVILFDEVLNMLWPARIAWSSVAEAGLAFGAVPQAPSPSQVARIAGPYYAVH